MNARPCAAGLFGAVSRFDGGDHVLKILNMIPVIAPESFDKRQNGVLLALAHAVDAANKISVRMLINVNQPQIIHHVASNAVRRVLDAANRAGVNIQNRLPFSRGEIRQGLAEQVVANNDSAVDEVRPCRPVDVVPGAGAHDGHSVIAKDYGFFETHGLFPQLCAVLGAGWLMPGGLIVQRFRQDFELANKRVSVGGISANSALDLVRGVAAATVEAKGITECFDSSIAKAELFTHHPIDHAAQLARLAANLRMQTLDQVASLVVVIDYAERGNDDVINDAIYQRPLIDFIPAFLADQAGVISAIQAYFKRRQVFPTRRQPSFIDSLRQPIAAPAVELNRFALRPAFRHPAQFNAPIRYSDFRPVLAMPRFAVITPVRVLVLHLSIKPAAPQRANAGIDFVVIALPDVQISASRQAEQFARRPLLDVLPMRGQISQEFIYSQLARLVTIILPFVNLTMVARWGLVRPLYPVVINMRREDGSTSYADAGKRGDPEIFLGAEFNRFAFFFNPFLICPDIIGTRPARRIKGQFFTDARECEIFADYGGLSVHFNILLIVPVRSICELQAGFSLYSDISRTAVRMQ